MSGRYRRRAGHSELDRRAGRERAEFGGDQGELVVLGGLGGSAGGGRVLERRYLLQQLADAFKRDSAFLNQAREGRNLGCKCNQPANRAQADRIIMKMDP